MFNNFDFKKIALVLFSIVLILLISNLIVKKINEKDEPPKNRKSLSGIEIDSIFIYSLKNYGFSEYWIKKKIHSNKSDASLVSTFIVKVPKDIPIHLLLLEMQDLFWNYDVDLTSEEFSPTNRTLLKISSQNKTRLTAEFSNDDKILREFGTVSFLVYGFRSNEVAEIAELLNTPELYYIVITPSENSKKLLNILTKSKKRYAVLLDDNIADLNFKLSGSYSEDRLKRSIREIVGTFSNAVFFIIDDRSDIFESAKYKFIENEFNKRNIKIINKSNFISLDANNINVDGKFQEFMLRLGKRDEKVLLVSAEEFLAIVKLIPSYRKIGYKFIYPGDIIIKK